MFCDLSLITEDKYPFYALIFGFVTVYRRSYISEEELYF